MIAHLTRGVMLLALVCSVGASPSRAADIASAWPDWGSPPDIETDWPEMLPELPAAEGWAYYLGADKAYSWKLLGTGQGLLIASGPEHLAAFRLSDGAQVWETSKEDNPRWAKNALVGDGALYVQEGEPGISAFDLTTGHKLWSHEGLTLIAPSPDGVWTCRQTDAWQSGALQGNLLVLLNAKDGSVRQSYFEESFIGFSAQPGLHHGPMALATGEHIYCCFPDGKVLELAGLLPGGGPRLAADAESVITAHTVVQPRPAKERSRAKRLAGIELTCSGLPAGTALWHQSLKDLPPDELVPSWDVALFGAYCAVTTTGHFFLLDRKTGEIVLSSALSIASKAYPVQQLLPGLLLVNGKQYGGGTDHSLRVLNLTDLKWSTVPDALVDEELFAADGRVCYHTTQHGGWDAEVPENSALASLKLAPAGGLELAPGSVHWLTEPEHNIELVRAFYASAQPLSDVALMQRAVAAGSRGLQNLLAHATPADAPQLTALAALAAYLSHKQTGARYSFRASGLLRYHLRRLGAPVIPQVIDWAEDPRLADLRPRLRGLLAELGGPQAAEYLKTHDLSWTSQPRAMQAPPYAIERPQPKIRKGQGYSKDEPTYDFNQWVDATAPNGTRYSAFTHSGLGNPRGIYLGMDSNGDGRFDELLPTGEFDVTMAYDGLGGMALLPPAAGLGLRLDVSALELTHNQRHLKHNAKDNSDDYGQAERVTTRLDLAALRLDTDGDGLTDVAARLLLTDPAVADTDGDGLADGVDPTPLVNPAGMGPAERAVARALDFFYADRHAETNAQLESFPFTAAYFSVQGCGPVALERRAGYSVCLSTPAQVKRLAAINRGYPDFGTARISLSAPLGKPGLGAYLPHEAPAAVDVEGNPDSPEFGLSVDFIGQGYYIELRKIGGEFYPVRYVMTWIS